MKGSEQRVATHFGNAGWLIVDAAKNSWRFARMNALVSLLAGLEIRVTGAAPLAGI